LICSYIFTIYPPDVYGLPVTQDTNIDQSILADLFKMQKDPRAQVSIRKLSQEGFNAMVDTNMSSKYPGDEESGSALEDTEYVDLPDLSELEKMIDWDDIKDSDDPPAKSNQDYNDPQGLITT